MPSDSSHRIQNVGSDMQVRRAACVVADGVTTARGGSCETVSLQLQLESHVCQSDGHERWHCGGLD